MNTVIAEKKTVLAIILRQVSWELDSYSRGESKRNTKTLGRNDTELGYN